MEQSKTKEYEGQLEKQEKIEQDTKKQKELDKKHEELKDYKGEDRVVWAGELWEEIKEKELDKVPVVPTHFAQLDALIGNGFRKGELVVIGGFPNHGKTPFMLNLVSNMVNQDDVRSLFFTFEMTPEALLIRQNVEEDPDKLNFFLPRQNINNNVEWVRDRIIEAKVKPGFGVTCVFIDHLDFIVSVKRGDTEERAIRETVMKLKKIAIEEDVIIFLASHVRRMEKRGMEKAPEMTDFKGSAAIEGNADFCLMIHKVPDLDSVGDVLRDNDGDLQYSTGRSKLYIRKNRWTGMIGNIKLYHDIKTKKFNESNDKRVNDEF